MYTQEQKKMFALIALRPYALNPKLCAVGDHYCLYESLDGKKCVAGRYMLPNLRKSFNHSGSILSIPENVNREHSRVFVPWLKNILTTKEWQMMQAIHDNIALLNGVILNPLGMSLDKAIADLNLFTREELFATTFIHEDHWGPEDEEKEIEIEIEIECVH